ncbi:MAG: DUF4402 domain-containing protein [Burkholderiales bacterium]|jgi:hypothetical protein|nr:DUF4402 domain-containing protein [Burkholderiales bacterium]
MQKLCRLLAVSFAATFAPVNWAQTVTAVTPLAFGRFTAGAGTVTIDTSGNRSVTGVKGVSSTYTAATFKLDGNDGAPGKKGKNAKSYSYNPSSSLCTTGLEGAGTPMMLTNFTTDPTDLFEKNSKKNSIKLTGDLKVTVTIGATATVKSGQASGDYTCNLNLIVDFYD